MIEAGVGPSTRLGGERCSWPSSICSEPSGRRDPGAVAHRRPLPANAPAQWLDPNAKAKSHQCSRGEATPWGRLRSGLAACGRRWLALPASPPPALTESKPNSAGSHRGHTPKAADAVFFPVADSMRFCASLRAASTSCHAPRDPLKGLSDVSRPSSHSKSCLETSTKAAYTPCTGCLPSTAATSESGDSNVSIRTHNRNPPSSVATHEIGTRPDAHAARTSTPTDRLLSG